MWINKTSHYPHLKCGVCFFFFLLSNRSLITLRKAVQLLLTKKYIYIYIYTHVYIYIYKKNIRSSASFPQWLHTDHNKLLKRRNSNKSSLSDCSLLIGSISQHVYPISHTHTHTNVCAFCSAGVHSQRSSKPPACHLLLLDELCGSNQQGTQGSCKVFFHCISGELSKGQRAQRKIGHIQTWKPELSQTW